MRTAFIDIDQTALSHNLNVVRQLIKKQPQPSAQHAGQADTATLKPDPSPKVLAMVKANAYGHGVAMCLPALDEADAIGVATLAEALEARALGWDKDIVLIEGVFSHAEWQQALAQRLQCVIHHPPQLDWALQTPPTSQTSGKSSNSSATASASLHSSRQIWLKTNTGMNRLGFDEAGVIAAAHKLHEAGYQLVLTSHFANADDQTHPMNQAQGEQFARQLTYVRQHVSADIQGSLCNSAGIVNFPQWHYDWVRPGIMLYGSAPVNDQTAAELDLQAVMTFGAALMAVHEVKAGAAVGYGGRWTAETDCRLGIVSIGYGDGFPRVLSPQAWVQLIDSRQQTSHQNNHQNSQHDNQHNTTAPTTYACPIRGRVAMDMIVIDLTGIPDDIALGSPVILWGASPVTAADSKSNIDLDGHHTPHATALTHATSLAHAAPHIDEVAQHAGTISYELLCRLTNRPTRRLASRCLSSHQASAHSQLSS